MQRVGRLDQPITIQSLTTYSDGMGGVMETYTTLAKSPKWAEYIPVKSNERLYADKLESEIEFKLRVRRDIRITAKCRVIHGTKTYRIYGGPKDYQRDNYMILRCQEIGEDGYAYVDSTYWNTIMTLYWDTPMTELWDTPMSDLTGAPIWQKQ